MNKIRENALLIMLWGLMAIPIMAMLFARNSELGLSIGAGVWFISILVIAIAFTDEIINREE